MKDRFSSYASDYAAFRPCYPDQLIDFIAGKSFRHDMAWDCGTGNGQVASGLSRFFTKVEATDISQKQIDVAEKLENIQYSVQRAEQTDFPDDSFDLIAVGQAVHWFDLEKFYQEVRRTSRGNGLIALFGYSPPRSGKHFDDILDKFYFEVIYPFWDSERKWVDDQYKSLPFPFDEIKSPKFEMNYRWTMTEMEGYINTWSAVKNYIEAEKSNPVGELMKELKTCWTEKKLEINFPIFIRIGFIKK